MKYLASALSMVAALAGCMPTSAHVVPPAPQGLPAPAPRVEAHTAIVISKTSIALSDNPRVLVNLPTDLSLGAPAEVKRQGINDFFIVPLAEALATEKNGGKLGTSIDVIIDETTSYRLLIEVVFTAGQAEIAKYDLHENKLDGRGFSVTLPRAPSALRSVDGASQAPRETHLNLTVLLVDDGIGLKVSGGNVAPGCNDAGPGLAISGARGHRDLAALAACVAKLKQADSSWANEDTVTVAPSPAISFHELVDVAEALRGAHGELFPNVQLGVRR